MDIISNSPSQYSPQLFSFADQIALVSECALMAGAIKRHYDDAQLMMETLDAQPVIDEMFQVIDASDALLAELGDGVLLNNFELDELKMVWNRLRYLVAITYKGGYILSGHYC